LGELRAQLERFAPDVVLGKIPSTVQQTQAVANTFENSSARVVAVSSGDVYRKHDGVRWKAMAPPDPVPLSEDAPARETRHPYRSEGR
jgi:hypothetical protein